MNTYQWMIDKLDTLPFFGGQYNVVNQVEWRLVATSTDPRPITATYASVTPLDVQDLTQFTPLDQCTDEVVVGWLTEGDAPSVNLDFIKSVLDAQINAQRAARG